MMTEKDLISRCKYYYNKVGYSFNLPVKINNRLTKTWGRFVWKYSHGVCSEYIEFSKKMLEYCTDDFIDSVIAHECAHALVWYETRESHHHDNVFKEMCIRLGTTNYTPHTKGVMKEGVSKSDLHKYTMWCKDCGETWYYDRKGRVLQNIENCSCSKCHTFNLTYKQNW